MAPEEHLPVKPVVLEILVALGAGALHGYAILNTVRERSHGALKLETGPLYRHLKRLLDAGLVEEAPEPDDVDASDQRRRYYRLTRLGLQVVRLETERLAGVLARASRLGMKEV